MTTSAPQWPGEDDHLSRAQDAHDEHEASAHACEVTRRTATNGLGTAWAARAGDSTTAAATGDASTRVERSGYLDSSPASPENTATSRAASSAAGGDATGRAGDSRVDGRPVLRAVPGGVAGRPGPGSDAGVQEAARRRADRRKRLVAVPDLADCDLRTARRRARATLPSPVAVTRDIALALLEVEAGCRSAAQLERIFSPELWEAIEHRISRRGGPLPSGRSLISVRCQEDAPGLADTVAVVQKGERFLPVALRLDAGGGRWRVTELRWWRNETDTAATSGRDGGAS